MDMLIFFGWVCTTWANREDELFRRWSLEECPPLNGHIVTYKLIAYPKHEIKKEINMGIRKFFKYTKTLRYIKSTPQLSFLVYLFDSLYPSNEISLVPAHFLFQVVQELVLQILEQQKTFSQLLGGSLRCFSVRFQFDVFFLSPTFLCSWVNGQGWVWQH